MQPTCQCAYVALKQKAYAIGLHKASLALHNLSSAIPSPLSPLPSPLSPTMEPAEAGLGGGA